MANCYHSGCPAYGKCDATQYGVPECVEIMNAYRTPTNADRIRSMTDEELVELFNGKFCPNVFDMVKGCRGDDCKQCWLDWLRSPVGNE